MEKRKLGRSNLEVSALRTPPPSSASSSPHSSAALTRTRQRSIHRIQLIPSPSDPRRTGYTPSRIQPARPLGVGHGSVGGRRRRQDKHLHYSRGVTVEEMRQASMALMGLVPTEPAASKR
jgi:hypothetical protein